MKVLDFVGNNGICSKGKIYLKTHMPLDFKFHKKAAIETLKFLCNTRSQINKYLLSAHCL